VGKWNKLAIRYWIRRLKRLFVYGVLHVKDTPHRIALGAALGVFVALTPTMGFQMLLVVVLAMVFRANKVVGLPFVWISNPLTAGPIYGSGFLLGKLMLGGNYRAPDFAAALAAHGSWWGERMANAILAWWHVTMEVFLPLWLGGVVMGGVAGTATYFLVRYAATTYQAHRHRHPREEPPGEES
jgi:uncharacterized protein (DUF2062 family)